MSDKTEHSQKRLPPVRLPFEKKRTDFGTWSYDHRVGIFITIIAYLLFGIVFITAKIRLNTRGQHREIIVELSPEQQRELTRQERQILNRMLQEDFSDVRNRTSNENAEADRGSEANSGEQLNSDLRDDRGTEASRLYEDAGRLEERIQANRAAYEAGLAQERAMAESGRNTKPDATRQPQDSKVQGRVTVSFSFTDPVRTSVNLITPAYMCSGGGVIELSVTLDNNGYVTSRSMNRNASAGDECMLSAAIAAAERSRFNVDPSAPSGHKGTITYTFIPQ